MLTTPERSLHRPPSAASRIGQVAVIAARRLPWESTSLTPVITRTAARENRAASPIRKYRPALLVRGDPVSRVGASGAPGGVAVSVLMRSPPARDRRSARPHRRRRLDRVPPGAHAARWRPSSGGPPRRR